MSDKTKELTHSRLTRVSFVTAIDFAGTSTSVRIQKEGFAGSANVVDSITPAKVEFDGSCTPTDKGQRADGFLLKKRQMDRNKGVMVNTQAFVGWSNVAELGYSE